MPGVSQVIFVAIHLTAEMVRGKRVLDVGACNFNGSIKPLIESHQPSEYIGIDVISGRDVDQILPASAIVERFGSESFDLIVCLEMLEHAEDWKACIDNMKGALRPGGFIFLTTRSAGYPCHGFPHDFWRFSPEDMRGVFDDFDGVLVEADTIEPGVFLFAERPASWVRTPLDDMYVDSVVTGQREHRLPIGFKSTRYYRRLALREKCKAVYHFVTRFFGRAASSVLLRG